MSIISNLLLVLKAVECIGAAYALKVVLPKVKTAHNLHVKNLWSLLAALAGCAAIFHTCWVVRLLGELKYITGDNIVYITTFAGRIAWANVMLDYYLLFALIDTIIKTKRFSFVRKFCIPMLVSIVAFGIVLVAFLDFRNVNPANRVTEFLVYGGVFYYVILVLAVLICMGLWAVFYGKHPRILKEQLYSCVVYFLTPHLLLIPITTNYFTIAVLQTTVVAGRFSLIILSDICYVAALIFCARRMIGLRFLNINKQVQRPKRYHFVDDFKDVLTNLGTIKNFAEVQALTYKFFERAFQVKPEGMSFHVRPGSIINEAVIVPALVTTKDSVEAFFADDKNNALKERIHTQRVLIRDELAFDVFYDNEPYQQELLAFLAEQDAELFLPIYEETTLIAYIIVARGSRQRELFSSLERDEMVIFANYLSGVIYLLQHRNLKDTLEKEHALQGDIYSKQREIQHYKESVRSLLSTTGQRILGIGAYHCRKICWMNDALRTIIHVPDTGVEHPVYAASVKELCAEAMRYKSERSIILRMESNRAMHCTAAPYRDTAQVLILTYPADRADTFTVPFAQLQDIASWEYALYLETTQSGALINQLIPGSTPVMLNFKIELLKVALTKKAILLEVPSDDALPMVHILHHISLRSKLHTITLRKKENNQDIGLAIFGMEPLIAPNSPEALLTLLDEIGTLFIQNVEYLSIKSQESLAEFIKSGMFKPLLSERLRKSNVHIICSTSNNIALLVEQQRFSASLYAALSSSTLVLPSLFSIPRDELAQLAHRIVEQTLQSVELRPLLNLNQKDIDRLIERQPLSISELKESVTHILQAKSHKHNIGSIVNLLTLPADNPVEIMQALRLGKRALQDRKVLLLLCNYFKSQARIATLLNVNRSSVHRRCKEFNIIMEDE